MINREIKIDDELDVLDLHLLGHLQQDASISNLALAEKLRISPPTCLRRVKRLTEGGWIERKIAVLNPARLGASLGHIVCALVEVTLDAQGLEPIQEGSIGQLPLQVEMHVNGYVEAGGTTGAHAVVAHRGDGSLGDFVVIKEAQEIGAGKGIIVRRPDAQELLSIRRGEVDLTNLIEMADQAIEEMDNIFDNSDLPKKVNPELVNTLLIKIRKEFYGIS
jgi:DNA-binding Lrp family transcriptional regulator